MIAKTLKFCPQIGNAEVLRAANDGFAGKAQRRQPRHQQRLAVGIVGRDGRAGNQLFGKLEC